MLRICENLRGFTTSRPPLVLFVLSLGAFAIVLLTLAYIVKVRDLPDPDTRDWNTFLDGFNQLEFCMLSEDYGDVANATREHLADQGIKDVVEGLHAKIQGDNSGALSTQGANSDTSSPASVDHNRVVSVSVPVWAVVKPTAEFVNSPHNITHLSTTMTGKQIGITGPQGSVEFNVTLLLPYTWNSSMCRPDHSCTTVNIHTCLNIQAPAKFFPQTRIPDPFGCQMDNSTVGVENHFHMVTQTRRPGAQRSVHVICEQKPSFTLSHKTEPGLNIMLTFQDRSAINLHLMHTSYFLFVMVVTMMCYALIRGKPGPSTKPIQYTEVSHA